MRPQGWYRDPYGSHDERWFSAGEPTSLVRDDGIESHDEPPRDQPPELLPLIPADSQPAMGGGPARGDRGWQWWTVVPPALLALAALWFAALGGIGAVAMNCFDTCHSNGPGMAVGVGAVPILGFAALTLLVTGLCVPAWREVIFAVLWAVFLLACGSAALVFTAAG